MTFDPSVPNASQSPGLFPAQMNADLGRLKTIISGDHVFNDTAPSLPPNNDGAHKQMSVVARVDPTGAPAPGTNGMLYAKIVGSTAKMFYYDGNRVFKMAQVLAAVTFNNAGTIQGNPFNVNSPIALAGGVYTITFTVPLPDEFGQFSLTCVEPSTNAVIAKVLSFTANLMTVRFVNLGAQLVNPITTANLIVFGG